MARADVAQAGNDGVSPAQPEQLAGRAATEAALEDAAMALLARDGVLAGLNLREVAEEAGVNRGLVYHYFGSRGKLLRRALRRRGERSLQQLRHVDRTHLVAGQLRLLQVLIGDPETVKLRTLLLIDGTERMRMMPLRDHTQSLLRDAVTSGELDSNLDVRAVHSFLVTSVYGYVLYREAFAAELGVELGDLDGQFTVVFERALRSLQPPGD